MTEEQIRAAAEEIYDKYKWSQDTAFSPEGQRIISQIAQIIKKHADSPPQTEEKD